MPHYAKYLNPDITDENILPASMSKEILTGLLRDKLGFNGMVVTDATAMVGYNVSMPRSHVIPTTIENGCDMILFNKNIDEDYRYMKDGLMNGLLSEERLNEAVLRILGTKMSQELFREPAIHNDLEIVGCEEHKQLSYQCARDAITLVKNKQDVLPISPQKYKRVRVYNLTDSTSGGFKEEGTKNTIQSYLENLGFEVDVYDYEHLNFYEIFETGSTYIKDKYDLVIYVANFDTASNYTVRRIEWIKLMAADAPWFVQEVPTIFISMANPYHLIDVPYVKTYINCYSNNDASLEALVNKLVGKEEFKGVSPVDAFCGKWDTRR